MFPLPHFVRLSLSWIFASWLTRNRKAVPEENRVPVDQQELSVEDEERDHLWDLTDNMTVKARLYHLETFVESVNTGSTQDTVVNMEEEGSSNLSGNEINLQNLFVSEREEFWLAQKPKSFTMLHLEILRLRRLVNLPS